MKLLSLAFVATVLGSTEYGLTGFPAKSYDPTCATACLRSFYTLTLDCSNEGVTIGMVVLTTSTECYANNTPFLTSVAWCAYVHCQDARPSASLLEYWWDMQITGQKSAGLNASPAKWTYAEALAQVATPPSVQLRASDRFLNTTSLVPPSVYLSQYNVLYSTQEQGTISNAYGIAILVVGFTLPMVCSWLGYLPGLSTLFDKLKPYILWPSTIGSYHIRPLPFLLGRAPTIGQALYIFTFATLNIVLTASGYCSRQPNAWNPTVRSEILSYVLGRTGALAYIFLPLLFLFGGRNNVLLWMTDWSHSTFLVLHRWIARIFTLQVLLHTLVSVAKYLESGMYWTERTKPYWIWGTVATVCVVVLCFGSSLYFRTLSYQTFLLSHIGLSVLVVVGCWYHAYDLYGMLGGYCYWIYAVSAVWAFDRVARLLRIWINGVRRAAIVELGSGYVRVDIPGVRWRNMPGMHAYLYFPTLTPWRPWENHPFSVMPTVLLHSSRAVARIPSSGIVDVEKHGIVTCSVAPTVPEPGLSFFIRAGTGFTSALKAQARIITLIEGPYPSCSCAKVLACDRLLLLGGGIGITALMPFVSNHWNIKLCWSVKESARCLVDELDIFLDGIVDKQVLIGNRFDVAALVQNELQAKWSKLGVVVSGPGSLCDETRVAIIAVSRGDARTTIELVTEAYCW